MATELVPEAPEGGDDARRSARAATSVAELLPRLSHELRTPLHGLGASLARLAGTPLDPTQRELVETADRCWRTMLRSVESTLAALELRAAESDGGAADAAQRLGVDLHGTVEEVVQRFAGDAAANGLDLGAFVHPALPDRLVFDRHVLQLALTELVAAALAATPRGHVVVRTGLIDASEDAVLMRVEVTGTDAAVSVDGLALAVLDDAVRLLGGNHGTDGGAAWFTARAVRVPSSAGRAGDGRRPLRVLVVDPVRASRQVLREQLRASGAQVECATDSATGLEWLRRAAARGRAFDGAMADAAVDHTGGLGFAAAVARTPAVATTPVVLLRARDGTHAGVTVTWLPRPVRQAQLETWLATLRDEPAERPQPRRGIADGEVPTVLVADDNEVNRQVATRMLEELGFRALNAEHGAEALEVLARERCHAVLMDCQMPMMDGFAATRAIRAGTRGVDADIPVIAVTAGALRGDRERCLAAGMHEYLSKPLRGQELASVLDRWVGLPAAAAADAATGTGAGVGADPCGTAAASSATVAACAAGGVIVLDEERLAPLRQLEARRHGFVAELVDVFLRAAPERIGDIRDGLARGDAETVALAAHNLKGSSANLGASVLSTACAALERCGRANDLTDAPALLTEVEVQYQRARTALLHEAESLKHG